MGLQGVLLTGLCGKLEVVRMLNLWALSKDAQILHSVQASQGMVAPFFSRQQCQAPGLQPCQLNKYLCSVL